MKIIILGAGQVGSSVAESLSSEANDLTVIDTAQRQLAQLRDRFDLRTVCGNAASPAVLEEAGAADADLLIAVTQSDQTNLCACRIARTLFNLPMRIARLRSADFEQHPELLDEHNFAVDHAICPEQVVTEYIRKLIAFPEALQVLDFGNGAVSLIAIQAMAGGSLVGHPLKALPFHLPNIEVRIAAIYRHGEPILPEGNTIIAHGDEVFCLAATVHIRQVMRELRGEDTPIRRVIIAGGGNIGLRLALSLEHEMRVKVIEREASRAETIAAELSAALVLHGDGTDENLLASENIDEMDMFIALTNDEEDNIMSASLAKRMGARRTLSLINRPSYVDLVQGGPIDIAISPAQASIGSLLAHVRRGDVVAVHSLRRGAAEALEIIAHGDARTSRVVGRTLQEINLPKGSTIGAVVRDIQVDGHLERRQVLMAHHDLRIESEDRVVVFCTHRRQVRLVEQLFQVGIGFF